MSDPLKWLADWHGVTGTRSSNTVLLGHGQFGTPSSLGIFSGNYAAQVSSGAGVNVTGAVGIASTYTIALDSTASVNTLNVAAGSTFAGAALFRGGLQSSASTLTSLVVTGGSTIGTVQAGASTATSLSVSGGSTLGTLQSGASTATSWSVSGGSTLGTLQGGASSLTSLVVSGGSTLGTVQATGRVTATLAGSAIAPDANMVGVFQRSAAGQGASIAIVGANDGSANVWLGDEASPTIGRILYDNGGAGLGTDAMGFYTNSSLALTLASNQAATLGGNLTVTGLVNASTSGVHINTGVAAVSSYTLYNDAGTLKWNGNTVAVGGSVSGTSGQIAKFTAADAVGDSIISESGSSITIAGKGNFRDELTVSSGLFRVSSNSSLAGHLHVGGNSTFGGTMAVTGASSFVGSMGVSSNVAIKGPKPWIDVRAYGAVGDGATDDATALQNAISAASAAASTLGTVFIPPGTYRCSATLTSSNTKLKIVGSGSGQSNIAFDDGVTHGIVFESTGHYANKITVQGLSLVTGSSGLGQAIRVLATTAASVAVPDVVIDDVYFHGTGYTASSQYWSACIYMSQCWETRITRCQFMADPTDGGTATSTTVGIYIQGGVAGDSTCISGTHWIKDCTFYNFYRGVMLEQRVEGLHVADCTFQSHGSGIYSSGASGRPEVHVSNCHIASRTHGVFLEGHPQSFIHDNLFYRLDLGVGTGDYVGVFLDSDSEECHIHNNQFHILADASSNNNNDAKAINTDARGTMMIGNSARLYGDDATAYIMYYLGTNADDCTVIGNRARSIGATTISNNGSSNTVANNAP